MLPPPTNNSCKKNVKKSRLGVVPEALGIGLGAILAPRAAEDSKREANLGSLRLLRLTNVGNFGPNIEEGREHVVLKTHLEPEPDKIAQICDLGSFQDLLNRTGTAARARFPHIHKSTKKSVFS